MNAPAGGGAEGDQPRHFAALDGMRGVLALGVVLLHLGFNSFAQRTFGWPGIAFELAVDVFFLLSGFVLAHALRRGSGFAAFAVRRCLRLLPVYYLTALAAAAALGLRVPGADWLVAAPIAGRQALNFPAWSITWELYLPLAVVLFRASPPQWAVRPLLATLLVGLAVTDIEVAGGSSLYGLRAGLGLAAGALLYRAKLAVPGAAEAWFATLVGAMIAGQAWPPAAAVVPFAAAAAIIAGRAGSTVFTTAPLQWLGAISYTLYMVHIPVLATAQALLGTRIDANAGAKLAILAASIAAAAMLTVAVERPANRLGHRLSRRIAAQQGLASRPAPTIAEP